MNIKEAIVHIERCLIYWNAGAYKNVDKRALELLLAYTKEALKTSHNIQSVGEAPQICPWCHGNGKVWRMNFAGAHDWYDCECKSGKLHTL